MKKHEPGKCPYHLANEDCPVCDDPWCECDNPGWACDPEWHKNEESES